LSYQYERQEFLVSNFYRGGEEIMKTCVVEVEIDQSQKSAIGNRWKNGKTIVFLNPVYPLFGGKWDSNRQIDIDSAAGTEHALYYWKRPFFWGSSAVFLCTQGYEGDTATKTLLKFDSFEKWKVDENGEGIFYFRGEEWNVYWEIIRFD
jgi:hypothetical protein